jgi:KDO2-lipid IV(A) lauroyltransferase
MEKIRKENICKNQIKKGRAGSREIIKNLIEGKVNSFNDRSKS